MITPYVLQGPHGLDARAKKAILACSGSNAIAIGSLVTTAGAAIASGETTAAYIVDAILLSDGPTLKQNQYLTGTEATAAAHYLRCTPLGGGVTIAIGEDGDGGTITDADWITSAKKYVDVVVTAPSGDTALNESSADGRGIAHANIKIDSSSANSSTSNLLLEILRPISPANFDKNATVTTTQPSSWSAASKGRVWECKVIDGLSAPSE